MVRHLVSISSDLWVVHPCWSLLDACSPGSKPCSAATLSFAVGDEEPQLAYTKLPAKLHPYVCVGNKLESSLMVVSDYRCLT